MLVEDEPRKTPDNKSASGKEGPSTKNSTTADNTSTDQKNKVFRRNWSGYINHKASKYKLKPLGGISGLVIYLNNKSERIIDEVIVKVTYYKTDGSVFETKEIRFNNIQPNSQDQFKVPNTQRGTKVTTEISKVTSRSYQFCYNSESSSSKSQSDPWFCK
jgi:serine/threonine-protein kinase